MPSGLEPLIPTAVKFVLGLGAKAIGAAVKRRREKAKIELADAIKEVEFSKSVEQKISNAITGALQRVSLSAEEFQLLLDLETNEELKVELATEIERGSISVDHVLKMWAREEPKLSEKVDQLRPVAEVFLDGVDKIIAERPELSALLQLRIQRETQRAVKSLEETFSSGFQQAEVQHSVTNEKLDVVLSQLSRIALTVEKPSDRDTGVQSLQEKRFERARNELIECSVRIAEEKFRDLIADLETAGGDQLLLFRSYCNLAAAVLEQNRLEEAAGFYQKANSILPDDWRAKRNRAIIAMVSGERETALAIRIELAKERPDECEHVVNAGLIFKAIGRSDEGTAFLQSNPFPNSSDFHGALALLLNEERRYCDAEAEARKGVAIDANNSLSLTALAASIALPIVLARTERRTMRIFAEEAECVRLNEAAKLAQTTADSLKREGRIAAALDVMGLLPSIYLMLGEDEKAVAITRELSGHLPEDVAALTNRWCAEMRADNHEDAVAVAERLFKVVPSPENWKRKAESFMAARQPEKGRDSWEADQVVCPGIAVDAECVAIAAECYSNAHNSEKALAIVEAALTRGESAYLLSATGRIHEALGDLKDASDSFRLAEAAAKPDERMQIVVDHACFCFRSDDWEGALRRFKEVGAHETRSSLLPLYAISLFNNGEHRAVIELCERAIKELRSPADDLFVVLARSYFRLEKFVKAKEILSKLVGRGGKNEFQHRKLLTYAYWHLDEATSAYDVARKAVSLNGNDPETFTLLSLIAGRLRKDKEAVDYARRAIHLSPNDLRPRMALVRSVLGVSKETNLSDEVRDDYLKSLALLEADGNRPIISIPIEEDFRTLKELLRKKSEQVQNVEAAFKNNALPIGFFAQAIGRSEFETWSSLLHRDRPPLRFQIGFVEDQQRQFDLARDSQALVIDLIALFTLQSLKLLHHLPKLFSKVHAHSSSLKAIVEEIRKLDAHPKQGSIAYVDGRIRMTERQAGEVERCRHFLEEIRDFLKSSAVELSGELPGSSNSDATMLVEKCGEASFGPVLLAQDMRLPLFCDDSAIAGAASFVFGQKSFCSQAFLRLALSHGILTEEDYQDALITLIEQNYWFVSTNENTLKRLFERAGGKISDSAKVVIGWVADTGVDGNTFLPTIGGFLVYLWNATDLHEEAELWFAEIWRSILRTPRKSGTVEKFLITLAGLCMPQPSTYFSLISWAEKNLTAELKEIREFRHLSLAIANQAYKVAQQMFPGNPSGQEWNKTLAFEFAFTALKIR
jgi:tetratricopeptide (TPR) repeat protein